MMIDPGQKTHSFGTFIKLQQMIFYSLLLNLLNDLYIT